MIISVNSKADKQTFEGLLSCSLFSLHQRAKESPQRFSTLLGNKLEREVVDVLNENALNTPFENSIELVSGQRFPDIVAKKYYGIEVKTTKENHWRSTGSSVAEGTRVSDVERIFMLFGKMCDPIEFRCRPYEECLSEVVVTHSPRYLINMDLKCGETFFDKIHVPYNDLRKQDNPIKTVVDYYKSQLKVGERLWWMGDEEKEQPTSSLIIRLWNHLDRQSQEQLKIQGYCLFPELLGKRNDKFNRFAVWLSTTKAIVCPNVRDQFTAGGRKEIIINNHKISVRQIDLGLFNNFENVKKMLQETSADTLSEFWNCAVSEHNKLNIWKELVLQNNTEKSLHIILDNFIA